MAVKKKVATDEVATTELVIENDGVESTVAEVETVEDTKELELTTFGTPEENLPVLEVVKQKVETGLIPIPCNLLVDPIRYCLAPQKVETKFELTIPVGSVGMIFLDDKLTATTNVRLCNPPLMIGTGEPQEVVVYLSNAGNDGIMMYKGADFLKYLVFHQC